jgi:hypothetical protein
MNYQAFTNDSLTMYEGVRRCLAADDVLSGVYGLIATSVRAYSG